MTSRAAGKALTIEAKAKLAEILAQPALLEAKAAKLKQPVEDLKAFLTEWSKTAPARLIKLHAEWLPTGAESAMPPPAPPLKASKPAPRNASKARATVETSMRIAREEALTMSQTKGLRSMKVLLQAAQNELNVRLAKVESAGAGPDSFSAARARATIEQVQAVTASLTRAMKTALVGNAEAAANLGAQNVIDHLVKMDKVFRGVGTQPLALDEARMFDRAIQGSRASILNRLSSGADAKTPVGQGILRRYGDAVVRSFEERLQMAAITRQPWAEVRNALVKESPFLQAAPAHWAERIVRTETLGAMQRSAWEATRAADDELGDVVKILCATFDDRTSADSYCQHGQIRRPAEAFEWWGGLYQHPPNRPNDREVVIMHRIAWPLPDGLLPKSDSEVAARWRSEGRKGNPPPRPKMTTVPLELFGRAAALREEDQAAPTPTENKPSKPTPEQRAEITRILTGAIKIR